MKNGWSKCRRDQYTLEEVIGVSEISCFADDHVVEVVRVEYQKLIG